MNISCQAINNSVGFERSESDYRDDVGHLCKADLLVPAARGRSIHGIPAMCGQTGHFPKNSLAVSLCFSWNRQTEPRHSPLMVPKMFSLSFSFQECFIQCPNGSAEDIVLIKYKFGKR